ncbi:Probable bifunctional methylthioribulose-1-phosphate dehydratase/enolase-phosphatase E1 [Linum grandiflorum]
MAANGEVDVASQAYLESEAVNETRALISDLCRQFYSLGWVSGTGGSITSKVHDDRVPKPHQLILMSPSGVQKERMQPDDMYVMSGNGSIFYAPSPKPYPHKPPKCSDCAPLFMKFRQLSSPCIIALQLLIYAITGCADTAFYCNSQAYQMRDAGAVIHSHGMESCLVTMLNPSSKEFRITHMEMIKGIKGHGYYDELVVPIIENTAYENELTDSLTKAIEAYPKTTAVLVRNHGIYVWGDTWISAKTQAECYHYLFDAAIKLHQMGLDWSTPSHGPIQHVRDVISAPVKAGLKTVGHNNELLPRCILLDIEGTTTPITFVSDVLFPYARDNVGKHLSATYDTEDTQGDIKLLRSQVEDDLAQGVSGAVPIPPDDAGKDAVIAALVANVDAMIKADRKITALKQLQGHIWRTGFQNNELKGVIYDDVPEALQSWHGLGIKVYIYSSGSRLAQRLLFGNTNCGDLRKYLSGFFDTTIGNKKETSSYIQICETLGVDRPSEILFLTDVVQEAVAAKGAGLKAMISVRPGNASLPENHGFKTINSFLEI